MAKYVIEDTTLTNIASAIREKTGKSDLLLPSQMPSEIQNIQTGGTTDEYLDFSNISGVYYEYSGYNLVSRMLLKKLPDIDLSNLTGTYRYLFQYLYSLEEIGKITVNPTVTSFMEMFKGDANLTTIDLSGFAGSSPTRCNSMFSGCEKLANIDLSYIKFGVGEANKFVYANSMFQNCKALTTIDLTQSNTQNITRCSNLFDGCTSLETIPKINLEKTQVISDMLNNCTSLVNVGGFENLGMSYDTTKSASYSSYTLSLSTCNNLSKESLLNIINNLYDIGSIGVQPQNLVLGSTNMAKLTEDEIALATNKGWVIS